MAIDASISIGKGTGEKTHVILLLLGSAVIIFVENAKDGKPQDGNQYIAIGVVGFILLFLAEWLPALAFAFALLFFVAVILNSPNGIPVIESSGSNVAAQDVGTASPQAVANNGKVTQTGEGGIIGNGY